MRDTSDWNQLDPKVKTLWRASGLISAFVIASMFLGAEFLVFRRLDFFPPTGVASLIVLVVIGLPAVLLADASYKNSRYRLGGDDLAYSKGIIYKSQRFINRARIQHVDITQGILARMLGLVEVSVFVGGQMAAAITIHGLTREEGERLRAALLEGSMVRYREAVEPPPVAPGPAEAPPLPPAWPPPAPDAER